MRRVGVCVFGIAIVCVSLHAADSKKLRPIPLAFPSWVELGPNPIPNGQTTPVNPVSGRVTAIEIDPGDPNKVYVGASAGGVYRSLDGGATWTAIFDGADSLSIGALALDAANGRLYVGTGDSNGAVDCFSGVGVYRIDNINTNPTLVGPINPVRGYNDGLGNAQSVPAFNGATIGKILIVPDDPTTIFVATSFLGVIGIGADSAYGGTVPNHGIAGLYRLGNATGAPASVTVTKIGVSSAGTCYDSPCTGSLSISDMVFDPLNSSGNILILWQKGINVAGEGGVWRSTNAMAATPIFTQTFITTATSTSGANGRLAIYAPARLLSNSFVYAASGEPNSGTSCTTGGYAGALRVSTDGGVTFGAKLASSGGFCGSQCFFDIGLAVSPGPTSAQNDDVVYLGGADSTACSRLAAKSTDGGTTFVESNGGVHSSVHVIKVAYSNPNILYRGDDGGIFKSTNAGVDWTSLNNTTFRATQFQSIAVHPTDPDFTIGGTQGNGTINLQSGPTWNQIDNGDGGFVLIDQNAADTTNVVMYHTFFNVPSFRVGYVRVDTVTAATDGNWTNIGCNLNVSGNGISCADNVLLFPPMAAGPGNPNTIYFGTDRLYRSVNKGGNNVVVSQAPLLPGTPISSIAISPQDDNFRIVGLRNGALFYTLTGSSVLLTLDPFATNSVIPDKYIARIVFDPTDKKTAYICLGGYMGDTTSAKSHVWKVTNLFPTPVLTAINGSGTTGLPDVPVNGFAIDPQKTTRLFAGTDIGVYDSEDGGATWSPFGLGLPHVPVFDMAIQNVKRVLRIATHGRGMWEIGLPLAGEVIVNPPSGVTAIATSISTVHVSWSSGGTATSYQIWRSDHNGAYAQVGTSMGTSFDDTASVSPNTTYLYKMKSVDASLNVSPLSNMDFATTVIFDDDPIAVGITAVQGRHLTQLRTAVNAMQLAGGPTATSFSDPTVNNSLLIKAMHIAELRSALNAARMALGVPQLLFANPALLVGTTVVSAIDFQELRDGVK